MGRHVEKAIVVDGVPLTEAQSMTVRVALTGFEDRMSEPDVLGKDERGRTLARLYLERAGEVLALLLR